jgi:hypothetical protein
LDAPKAEALPLDPIPEMRDDTIDDAISIAEANQMAANADHKPYSGR